MVGGGGANVGGRLRLGEGDLRFGLLGAAGDEVARALRGVLGQLLGLGARFVDDRGGVRLRFGLLFFSKLASRAAAS